MCVWVCVCGCVCVVTTNIHNYFYTPFLCVCVCVCVGAQSFVKAVQSSSEVKSTKKVPMSKSEASFIQQLVKDHGSDFTVSPHVHKLAMYWEVVHKHIQSLSCVNPVLCNGRDKSLTLKSYYLNQSLHLCFSAAILLLRILHRDLNHMLIRNILMKGWGGGGGWFGVGKPHSQKKIKL